MATKISAAFLFVFGVALLGGGVLLASLGGSPRHPDWFHNLARNPDRVWIEVAQRRWKVRPESLRGAEREEAWRRIVALAPGYAGYQEKTDRIIPVVRLVRVSPG